MKTENEKLMVNEYLALEEKIENVVERTIYCMNSIVGHLHGMHNRGWPVQLVEKWLDSLIIIQEQGAQPIDTTQEGLERCVWCKFFNVNICTKPSAISYYLIDVKRQGYECPYYDPNKSIMDDKKIRQEVLGIIASWGGIDGEHHKQWVLDQVVRLLAEDYEKWVEEYENGEDGPDTYSWDEGVAP